MQWLSLYSHPKMRVVRSMYRGWKFHQTRKSQKSRFSNLVNQYFNRFDRQTPLDPKPNFSRFTNSCLYRESLSRKCKFRTDTACLGHRSTEAICGPHPTPSHIPLLMKSLAIPGHHMCDEGGVGGLRSHHITPPLPTPTHPPTSLPRTINVKLGKR